jgi:hypothetical protein
VIPALYAKFGKWLVPKQKQTALDVAIAVKATGQ